MPTPIARMTEQLERLRKMKEDGQRFSESGNSVAFDTAWYEEAIRREHIRAEQTRSAANLGERFAVRTFRNFDKSRDPDAFAKAKTYVDGKMYEASERNSLTLMGPCGTGKTHIAAAISNQLIDEGVPVLFDTFSGYLEKLRREFDKPERKWLERMKNIPMLILDDVGKEKQSEWTQQVMFDVINHRYENLLPIIITTNLGRRDLENYLGQATFSRICEMSVGIVMNGADKRKE